MALRNSPRISQSVREKIARLAENLGYQRDPIVSSLMNQLRTTRKVRSVEKIAYLTFWNTADGWQSNTNEFGYFQGVSQRAGHLGYEVEAFWAKQPGMSGARLSRILYTRGIRGVILAPLPRGVGHVSLDWKHFAAAALSLTVLKPDLHRASHDYHDGMNLALHSLKKLGYKRPGFANMAIFDQRTKHGWLSGFLTYQYNLPLAQRIPPYLVPGVDRDTAWDRERFSRWLDKWKPDSIVSNTEQPLHLCQELGYKAPKIIGFASLHKLHESDPWAGIDRQSGNIGAAGVDLVVAQLQNNEFGLPQCPKTVLINSLWCDGPTVTNLAAPVGTKKQPRPRHNGSGRAQVTPSKRKR